MIKTLTRIRREWKYLNVKRDSLVLEIGSGSNPCWRSDVLLDKFPIISETHRTNLKVARLDDRPFIVGDAHHLPFLDQVFDFVIMRHLLEHSANPRKLIEEVKRVAKAGYISTPSPFVELVHGGYRQVNTDLDKRMVDLLHHGPGSPGHKWFVLMIGKRIVLLPKSVELYPMYLVFGSFVKNHTDYQSKRFFKEKPTWLESQLKFDQSDDLELIILKDTDQQEDEPVNIDHLREQLVKISSNYSLSWKSVIRKQICSTTRQICMYDLLACPMCKTKLVKAEDHLICLTCGHFPVVNNVPVLLPEAVNQRSESQPLASNALADMT